MLDQYKEKLRQDLRVLERNDSSRMSYYEFNIDEIVDDIELLSMLDKFVLYECRVKIFFEFDYSKIFNIDHTAALSYRTPLNVLKFDKSNKTALAYLLTKGNVPYISKDRGFDCSLGDFKDSRVRLFENLILRFVGS